MPGPHEPAAGWPRDRAAGRWRVGTSIPETGVAVGFRRDEETTRLENGLTVLATVGATAPFVGLFGTVWGVYHALLAIGMSGAGTLDKVAGPVGEALVMTGIGLAVAIPAVVGYNAITRSNRVLCARLDAFAHELLTFLSTGTPMARAEAPAAVAALWPLAPASGAALRA